MGFLELAVRLNSYYKWTDSIDNHLTTVQDKNAVTNNPK